MKCGVFRTIMEWQRTSVHPNTSLQQLHNSAPFPTYLHHFYETTSASKDFHVHVNHQAILHTKGTLLQSFLCMYYDGRLWRRVFVYKMHHLILNFKTTPFLFVLFGTLCTDGTTFHPLPSNLNLHRSFFFSFYTKIHVLNDVAQRLFYHNTKISSGEISEQHIRDLLMLLVMDPYRIICEHLSKENGLVSWILMGLINWKDQHFYAVLYWLQSSFPNPTPATEAILVAILFLFTPNILNKLYFKVILLLRKTSLLWSSV